MDKSCPRTHANASSLPPFRTGVVVLITLNNPREKFWGVLLALDPAGVSVQGIELASFEDSANMVAAGESLVASALFFPMHRVERIQLDLPEGAIPSLGERFRARTGLEPATALLQYGKQAAPAAGSTGE